VSDVTIYPAAGQPAGAAFVLAHGAGAGQRHPFIAGFAAAWARLGLDVVTFDFPYITAGRRIPDRGPVLQQRYREVIDAVRRDVASAARCLVVGGKSMGGRIATEVVAADAALKVAGVVLLGYPLHPPGRPQQRRDAHLRSLERPVLVVQGSRDAFGTPEELGPVLDRMSPRPTLHVVESGDHSFKLARRDPAAQAAVYETIQQTVAGWIRALVLNAAS
jgi:predicted alpha/beta-hydrolase family hydrolase